MLGNHPTRKTKTEPDDPDEVTGQTRGQESESTRIDSHWLYLIKRKGKKEKERWQLQESTDPQPDSTIR